MSNDVAVFEKKHSRLIFNSSPQEHLKEAIQIAEQENWLNPKRMAPGCLLGGALLEFVGMILQMTHGLLKRAAASLRGKK